MGQRMANSRMAGRGSAKGMVAHRTRASCRAHGRTAHVLARAMPLSHTQCPARPRLSPRTRSVQRLTRAANRQ